MNWFTRHLNALRPAAAPTPAWPAHAMVIDVRSDGEYRSGHIHDALNLPLDRLQASITTRVPDLHTPLLLYCQSGARSGMACELLARMGYSQVVNGGGMGVLALSLGQAIVTER